LTGSAASGYRRAMYRRRRCAAAAVGPALSGTSVAASKTPEHFGFTAEPARSGAAVTLGFDFGTTARWTSGRFGFAVPRGVWNGRRIPTCGLRALRRCRQGRYEATAVVHYRDSSPDAAEEAAKGVGVARDSVRCRAS